jgi:thiamine biosynthesis lipoprotein
MEKSDMTDVPRPRSLTRRRFLLTLGAAGGSVAAAGWLWRVGRFGQTVKLPAGLRAATRTGSALGTDVSMTALHESQAAAERALDAAFAELDTVESVMSLYRPNSQLCQLNAQHELRQPHPYLVQVLRKAEAVSAASDGAFDVTVQPLWTLYANSADAGRMPSAADIERVTKHVNWRQVEVADDRVQLHGAGTAVTLNGIAQGFAADRVLAALAGQGIRHALVNTGEIGTMGRRADGERWTIGVQDPRHKDALLRRVQLEGLCMATSGDYETTFTPDYVNNHIFDPQTGRSPQAFQSVTIVAKTGLDADALSTAVFVAGLDRGIKLIESIPGADGFFVMKNGQTRATSGFQGQA